MENKSFGQLIQENSKFNNSSDKKPEMSWKSSIPKEIGKTIGSLAIVFLNCYLFEIAWNHTLPVIFAIKEITYSQAMWFYLMVSVIVSAFKSSFSS